MAVGFTVDPAGFTRIVRDRWFGDRQCAAALKLLVGGMGMNTDQALDVIAGRQKLVSEDGVNFDLEPDQEIALNDNDVVPSMDAIMARLKWFEDREEAMLAIDEAKVLIHRCLGRPKSRGLGREIECYGSPAGLINARTVVEFLGQMVPEPTTDEWEAFWNEHASEVRSLQKDTENVAEYYGADDRRDREDFSSLDAINDRYRDRVKGAFEPAKSIGEAALSGDVSAYIAAQIAMEEKSCPPPDTKLEARDGWILPDGKFYPCGYMEHIWLADKLGKSEPEAEKLGWVKIHHALDGGLYITINEKRFTQKQQNTLFDWCQKHGIDYDKYVKES